MRRRVTIIFPESHAWAAMALDEIVAQKIQMGMATNASFEAARIISNYLQGIITDRPTDCELLARWKQDFLT